MLLLQLTFVIPDIDECTGNVCAENADCMNTDGSFQCFCQNGYTGDGITNCSGKTLVMMLLIPMCKLYCY